MRTLKIMLVMSGIINIVAAVFLVVYSYIENSTDSVNVEMLSDGIGFVVFAIIQSFAVSTAGLTAVCLDWDTGRPLLFSVISGFIVFGLAVFWIAFWSV